MSCQESSHTRVGKRTRDLLPIRYDIFLLIAFGIPLGDAEPRDNGMVAHTEHEVTLFACGFGLPFRPLEQLIRNGSCGLLGIAEHLFLVVAVGVGIQHDHGYAVADLRRVGKRAAAADLIRGLAVKETAVPAEAEALEYLPELRRTHSLGALGLSALEFGGIAVIYIVVAVGYEYPAGQLVLYGCEHGGHLLGIGLFAVAGQVSAEDQPVGRFGKRILQCLTEDRFGLAGHAYLPAPRALAGFIVLLRRCGYDVRVGDYRQPHGPGGG